MCVLVLPAAAHPMGNFSINHYARIGAEPGRLKVRYIIDMAEIPTVTERGRMDGNHDGKIDEPERSAYLRLIEPTLRSAVRLSVNGRSAVLTTVARKLEFRPGAGGLPTLRIGLEFLADAPDLYSEAPVRIDYSDANYPERTGWKEIVTVAERGLRIQSTDVALADASSELNVYPTDPSIVPPQQISAVLVIGSGPGPSGMVVPPPRIRPPAGPNRTPQDAFTQSIAARGLTPRLYVLLIATALLFGAFHALAPGHGKAMVAAYLVGSRGTAAHAILLGAVVTITHTIGVFVLGFVTLNAAQYVVPEKLYPLLGAISGMSIVIIGVGMLVQRLRANRPNLPLKDEWDEGEGAEAAPVPSESPINVRTLIALGITGGAIPCPSALVVMLSAIAMHRVGLGIVLILAFSLGLAAVLTAIGIVVVRARGLVERIPWNGRIVSRLPVLSAVIVIVIGSLLTLKALQGGI